MIITDVRVATLAVATDVGPIVGCGLIFGNEEQALAFVREAQEYYESPSDVEKTFIFAVEDKRTYCNVRIVIIVGDKYTELTFDRADRRILDDLAGALERQPYFFIILAREEESGVVPMLQDEIVMYRAVMEIDGQPKTGRVDGQWPSTGQIDFD